MHHELQIQQWIWSYFYRSCLTRQRERSSWTLQVILAPIPTFQKRSHKLPRSLSGTFPPWLPFTTVGARVENLRCMVHETCPHCRLMTVAHQNSTLSFPHREKHPRHSDDDLQTRRLHMMVRFLPWFLSVFFCVCVIVGSLPHVPLHSQQLGLLNLKRCVFVFYFFVGSLSHVPLHSTGRAADAYFFCQVLSGACLSFHSSTLTVEIVCSTLACLIGPDLHLWLSYFQVCDTWTYCTLK